MTRSRPPSTRILIVTPETAFLPTGLATNAGQIRMGSGVLAQTAAALITSLFQCGFEVHVALPDYRRLFDTGFAVDSQQRSLPPRMLDEKRVHLAQDRYFFYQEPDKNGQIIKDSQMSLAFQREVINHIIPTVRPDLIHCMDWTTGLIPAMLHEHQIPCLFSFHNWETGQACLSAIEDRGIDAADFWHRLYFRAYPTSYELVRETLPVDFLASGILASRYIWLSRPHLLGDILTESFSAIREDLKLKLINTWEAGRLITGRQVKLGQVMALYANILGRPLDIPLGYACHRMRQTAPFERKSWRSLEENKNFEVLSRTPSPDALPRCMAS